MAWLHSAPKEYAKEESPRSRIEKLEEDDPVRELPPANEYLTECFIALGICSSNGMGAVALTFSDVQAFSNQSSYYLDGWESEQVVNMSRTYCRMLHDAGNDIAIQAPYNLAASDEHALQKNRDKVAQQFMAMRKKRA
ncbi:MAG: hypothetical protein GY738_00105 [Pseudoalteromonas sp.]|nr:hypothetical protein [Pseudoalteromonas sp.]